MRNKVKDGAGRLVKAYRWLLWLAPAVVYFSYFPVIALGSNETMNFELSVPLVWLVVFDAVAVVLLVRERVWREMRRGWAWLLFPVWATLSVGWSLNAVRGVLTAGVMWLLVIAVYGMVRLRRVLDAGWWKVFWRVFWVAGVVACVWCVTQCVLDLAGVSQDVSLMCDGCVSQMFGFPHPNGFAIEPQFMGNLLLAPAMASAWLAISANGQNTYRFYVLFLVFASGIFLTFSRGAIYAMGMGLGVMTIYYIARRNLRALWIWGAVVLSFLFTLNLQGVMTAVGPTSDGYFDGVAKVVNHLTLGVVDVRGSEEDFLVVEEEGELPAGAWGNEAGTAGDSEANMGEGDDSLIVDGEMGAVFDGYVAESTETRLRLTGAAVEVWRSSFPNAVAGVGLGGAGQALYDAGLTPAPKEIVQNEYASLLLETGVMGVSLFVALVVLVVRWVWRQGRGRVVVLALMVAYGVTLLFFSGLTNALHIYLLPAMLAVFASVEEKICRK